MSKRGSQKLGWLLMHRTVLISRVKGHSASRAIFKSLPRRTMLILLAVVILLPSAGWLINRVLFARNYRLLPSVQQIVGTSTVEASLIKDNANDISYNRAEDFGNIPEDVQKVLQLAANKEDSSGKKPYQVSFSKDIREGIRFSDSDGERSVSLMPKFTTASPRLEEGKVIYPKGSNEQHIYTFKNNGIKNDIVIKEVPDSNEQTYEWELETGSDLEMRLLPSGGVGIYSADPLLFGEVQASDDDSAARLQKARENSDKNYLVFELPAPFITDLRGLKNYDDVNYKITNANTLRLEARNLRNLTYPLSIDPTITITTTSDFGQNTGNVSGTDYAMSGEVRRNQVLDGRAGSENIDDSQLPYFMFDHTNFVYNGFIYTFGGTKDDLSNNNDVIQYCPLNANGSVGACSTQTTTSIIETFDTSVLAYNGYLYQIGGPLVSGGDDISYCPLNADGSIGTCTQQANVFTSGRTETTSIAYNGYLYIIGGYDGFSALNDIQYCPLNADGSIGTCTQQTNAFTTGRHEHTSVFYNGYLYIIGGDSGIATYTNDIQYCPLNANGSVGTCTQQTNAFTNVRAGHASTVIGGNLYIIGGIGSGGVLFNDINTCPLNANGSVGTCSRQASAFTNVRESLAATSYNGYLYISGGRNSGLDEFYNDYTYFSLSQKPNTGWSTDTTNPFTGARYGHGGVIHGGYYFVFGGFTGSGHLNDVWSAPINIDGSLGTFTRDTNSDFTNARRQFGYFVYNGYLYIGGGWASGSNFTDVQYALICTGANNGVSGCGTNAGEVGTWNTTTASPPTARRNVAATAYNGYAYFVGGNDGSPYNSVMYGQIASSGNISSWTTDADTFTTARYGAGTVAYNGYLYVVGGNDFSTSLSDVQYAAISSSDGSIGSWSSTSSFTTARQYLTLTVYNGVMYLNGGEQSTPSAGCKNSGSLGWCSDTQYATINSNGSLGSWTTSTWYMANLKMGHTSGIVNGFLYVVGGVSNGVYYTDSLYLPVDIVTRGLGTNTQQTSAFTTARAGHSSVAYNGYLYIIGGTNGSYQNDIQRCPLNTNGSVGSCTQQTSAFTTARAGHSSVAYNGYLYIIGGTNGSYQNDIQRCPISTSNGSVGSCTQQTNIFTTARAEHASAVYNGYLYITGGTDGTRRNDVHYCGINTSTGAIVSCTQQTSAFTTAREAHGTVAFNGYLYIIGGYDGTNYLGDVQFCALSPSNGSVSACSTKGSAIDIQRSSFGVSVHNGYIVIAGGLTSGRINDIQYCPVAANGIPDQCIYKTSAFTTARDGHTTVLANGFVYTIGGDSGSYQNDINYSSIGIISQTASYERIVDSGSSANMFASFTINGTAPCTYRVVYKMAGASNVFGSDVVLPQVIAGVSQAITGGSSMRYINLSVTMDDSSCGTSSSITSIDVVYDQVPSAPTLLIPASSATSVSVLPEFRMGSSDVSNDYLRYRIQICSNNDCSSVVRTIDQTLSQTGWISQSQQSGTAYSGGEFITQLAIHQYQAPALSQSTQYWWRAQAIDPGGTNTWSAYSSIQSFTTGLTGPSQININGGTTINGGSTIRTGN